MNQQKLEFKIERDHTKESNTCSISINLLRFENGL